MKLSLFDNRVGRKFLRNRPALAAAAVIALYLVVAGYVGLCQYAELEGGITLQQTDLVIGPGTQPGFYLNPDVEIRLENCEFYVAPVARALGRSQPRPALKEVQFGNLHIDPDKPISQLKQEVAEIQKRLDVLIKYEDLEASPELIPRVAELEQRTAELFAPLSGWEQGVRNFRLLLGTDRQGRSILLRAIYSVMIAVQIGLVTSFLAVLVGSLLGAMAGYFGGWVDHAVIWLYSTLSSIPYLVLLVLIVYMFTGTSLESSLMPVYVAFVGTFWIGPCRVIRGETLKVKEQEYVQAAVAMGFGRVRILLRHILPNTAHLMLINCSLLFIGAIKAEVILSFLGLGVKLTPSWGIMISHARPEVINGFFWQIGSATAFMFVLVLAFNVLTDALQDVFDPKHL